VHTWSSIGSQKPLYKPPRSSKIIDCADMHLLPSSLYLLLTITEEKFALSSSNDASFLTYIAWCSVAACWLLSLADTNSGSPLHISFFVHQITFPLICPIFSLVFLILRQYTRADKTAIILLKTILNEWAQNKTGVMDL